MEQGNGDINDGTLWASRDIAALIARAKESRLMLQDCHFIDSREP